MKNKILIICLGLLMGGCGSDDPENNAGTNNSTTGSTTSTTATTGTTTGSTTTGSTHGVIEGRDVVAECSAELQRLFDCDAVTTVVRDGIAAEFCDSTDSRGQKATAVACLKTWTCGGQSPLCIQDRNPEPECSAFNACSTGQCEDGVCEP